MSWHIGCWAEKPATSSCQSKPRSDSKNAGKPNLVCWADFRRERASWQMTGIDYPVCGSMNSRGTTMYRYVWVAFLSHTEAVSVITRDVSRGTSSCLSPLPSHNISRMPYHARRRAAEFRGKALALRPREIDTTQPKYPYAYCNIPLHTYY